MTPGQGYIGGYSRAPRSPRMSHRQALRNLASGLKSGCDDRAMEGRSATIVGRLTGPRWGYVLPHRDGYVLQSHDKTSLAVTDRELRLQWSVELPPFRGCHALSADNSRIALLQHSELVLLDRVGNIIATFHHLPWHDTLAGACAFDVDGSHLWATLPSGDDVDLVLFSIDGLQVIERYPLESAPAGIVPVQHPDGRTIGWSIGEGQDRVLIRWSAFVGDRTTYRASPGQDRVLAAIHPEGAEYLTTPQNFGPITRHRIGDDRVLETLPPMDADQLWDFVAGYYDAEHIVAAIRGEDEDHRLLLINRSPLNVEAILQIGESANRWAELALLGPGGGIVVGDQATELWQLV